MQDIYNIIKPALLQAADPDLVALNEENLEYRKCMEQYAECRDRLKKALPPERMEDLCTLEELMNDSGGMELEVMYRRGMEDTLALLKMLQVI